MGRKAHQLVESETTSVPSPQNHLYSDLCGAINRAYHAAQHGDTGSIFKALHDAQQSARQLAHYGRKLEAEHAAALELGRQQTEWIEGVLANMYAADSDWAELVMSISNSLTEVSQ